MASLSSLLGGTEGRSRQQWRGALTIFSAWTTSSPPLAFPSNRSQVLSHIYNLNNLTGRGIKKKIWGKSFTKPPLGSLPPFGMVFPRKKCAPIFLSEIRPLMGETNLHMIPPTKINQRKWRWWKLSVPSPRRSTGWASSGAPGPQRGSGEVHASPQVGDFSLYPSFGAASPFIFLQRWLWAFCGGWHKLWRPPLKPVWARHFWWQWCNCGLGSSPPMHCCHSPAEQAPLAGKLWKVKEGVPFMWKIGWLVHKLKERIISHSEVLADSDYLSLSRYLRFSVFT